MTDEINERDSLLPKPLRLESSGMVTAPLDALVEYENNPRQRVDFDYDRSPSFRDLVDSVLEYGVLEPIRVFSTNQYGAPSKLHMLTGHRRKAAVEKANELTTESWEDQKARGETNDDGPDLITRVPVQIMPEPQSEFYRRSDMWTAELLRENWPTRRLIEFFSETYKEAPPSYQENPKKLNLALGLGLPRTKLMVKIVTSPVLLKAATDLSEEPLPQKGREKTMRSLIRCTEIIMQERSSVARKVTGLAGSGDRVWARLYEKLIEKAGEYNDREDLGSGPGVILERTATLLRNSEAHSDDDVVNWLTKPGVFAKEIVTKRRSRSANGDVHPGDSPLISAIKPHIKARPGSMTDVDLQTYADEMQKGHDMMYEEALKARGILEKRE